MRVLEVEDVISLLRSEVEQAGGQTAWSKKVGIHRTTVSKTVNGIEPPTRSIIRALKLRMVFVSEQKS